MLELEFIQDDDWNRPAYKDQNGNIWLDINLGDGKPDLHSSSTNEIDGEPNTPINHPYKITKPYKENIHKFTYMMLNRLKSDCDYFTGYGHKVTLSEDKINSIISEIKKLWNSLPDNDPDNAKPEWLTMEQIEQYEKDLKCNPRKNKCLEKRKIKC